MQLQRCHYEELQLSVRLPIGDGLAWLSTLDYFGASMTFV
jgi:hypothetical protein